MDQYTRVAYQQSEQLTKAYSTSFSATSKLLGGAIRPHIYAIYGLVRVADEIVDTYRGKDMLKQINDLEAAVYKAIKESFSAEPILHAFAITASQFQINKELIKPFFDSMRMDVIPPKRYSREAYELYIHGSAEVVGLMCLKVFVNNDIAQYEALSAGASALGSAFQKVNFLRDLQADWQQLHRYYFPIASYDSFDDGVKDIIVADIVNDFKVARTAIHNLPPSSRRAVALAFNLYIRLLEQLDQMTAEEIKQSRARLSDPHKLWLAVRTYGGHVGVVQ